MIKVSALCVLSAFLLMAGCVGPEEPDNGVQMPNPASVYCVEQGGKLEFRTDASGGQYGVCLLPSSMECEEWAYYRGECRDISNFEECAALMGVVMESHPRQCRSADGRIFVEEVPVCEDLCGDGICQEIVCMGVGCPCPETPESCPQDCA